jgi:hypothetical protein
VDFHWVFDGQSGGLIDALSYCKFKSSEKGLDEFGDRSANEGLGMACRRRSCDSVFEESE